MLCSLSVAIPELKTYKMPWPQHTLGLKNKNMSPFSVPYTGYIIKVEYFSKILLPTYKVTNGLAPTCI